MTKKLIVTADDFGLNPALNRGVLKAFKDGIVTSASIVSCGEAFDEAVRMSLDNRRLGVGIHLALTNDEKPVLPPEKIKSLVGKEGRFHPNPCLFFIKLALGEIDLGQIERELEAQITKVLESGITPTHINSHVHVHALRPVFRIVTNLARRYKIRHIRVPIENAGLTASPRAALRSFIFSTAVMRRGAFVGMPSVAVSCCGLVHAGRLTQDRLMRDLSRFSGGISELVCHPGIEDRALREKYRWNYRWGEELEALCSMNVKRALADLKIELINYRNI